MKEIYDKAWGQKSAGKGRTMKGARWDFLRQTIVGPAGPFCQIAYWARKEAKEAVNKVNEEPRSSLDEMLRKVQVTLEQVKTKKEDDMEEGKKFRTELHRMVDEARRILDGVAQKSLDLCKAYK